MLVIVFLSLSLAVTALTVLLLMTFLSVAFPGSDHCTSMTSTDSHMCRCDNCQSASADQQEIARRTVVTKSDEFTDQNFQHAQGGHP
ncbi:MAG: hypothetical protein P8K08_15960 [Fuerstiella sp.]|nr:hypothetical protein [Fuerstiella sp.]